MTPAELIAGAWGLAIGAAIAGGIALRFISRAYDSGWNDRGLHDWRKDMARRNAAGRFRPKQERRA
jgi:hypothetical protein